MASVSFSTIRSRFATKVATLSGFTISRNPFDDFNRNPNAVAHKRASVGVSMVARSDQRESNSVGVLCDSVVVVKYPYRLRPKDQVLDFDNSMDSVEEVIKACTVRAAPLHTNLQIFFNAANHEITDSGEYIINTLNFTVLHTIALI
jgi:hypothetical protein